MPVGWSQTAVKGFFSGLDLAAAGSRSRSRKKASEQSSNEDAIRKRLMGSDQK